MSYVDSSVLLRIVLDSPGALPKSHIGRGVSSRLTEVECLRTLDRLRLVTRVSAEEIARRRWLLSDLLKAVDLLVLSPAVLMRASQPLTLPLKTLDALHLASAMIWRETRDANLDFATHDTALANAARAAGFAVIGA